MPNWKYVVKRARFGKAQRRMLFEKIKLYVREEGLGLQIPMIKFERGARGEFYFGLATDFPDHDEDGPPEEVMDILDKVGLPRTETNWFEGHEVKSLLSGTIGFDSFAEDIKFEEKDGQEREKEVWDVEGWYRSLLTGEIEEKSVESPDSRDAYDQLLWLCSAMGNGSYKKFHDVCEALGLSQEKSDSYRILRNLSLLGHLEARKDSRGSWRWSIAPALAVSCAKGEAKFLAGQRVKRMEEKLAEVASLERRDLQLGPTNLRFEADADQSLDLGDGREVEDAGCVSQRLAEALPSVDVFAQNHLREDRNISPTSYEFERFDGNEFVSTTPGNLEEGLYEVRPSEGEHYPRKRLLDAAGIWRSGGYYDLRFVSLGSTGEKPAAAYDAKQSRLVMPARYHWPTIYEKSLVLAQGLLPEWKSNKNGADLYYQGVSEELATILCEKLNVELGSIG